MKFLSLTTLLSLVIATVALTKDDILAEREKRVKQLIHQLEMMEIVMNKHRSGDRVMTDDMLSSYRKRRAVYEDQLAEASVELTDEEIERLIAVESDVDL